MGVASRCELHTGFVSSKVGSIVWWDSLGVKSNVVEQCTVTARSGCLDLDPFASLRDSSRIEDKVYELSVLAVVDRSRMWSRQFSLKVDSVRSRT